MWKAVSVVALCVMSSGVWAENHRSDDSSFSQANIAVQSDGQNSSRRGLQLGDPTVGVWYSAPLGASVRLGLGFNSDRSSLGREDVVAGVELGQQGSKQFVGLRTVTQMGWGGIEFAHWKTKSSPVVGSPNAEYVGVEGQLLMFRMGVMVPLENADSPKLTFGIGMSI